MHGRYKLCALDFPQVRFLYFPVVFSTEGTGGGGGGGWRKGKTDFSNLHCAIFFRPISRSVVLNQSYFKHLSNDIVVFINKCLLNDYAK